VSQRKVQELTRLRDRISELERALAAAQVAIADALAASALSDDMALRHAEQLDSWRDRASDLEAQLLAAQAEALDARSARAEQQSETSKSLQERVSELEAQLTTAREDAARAAAAASAEAEEAARRHTQVKELEHKRISQMETELGCYVAELRAEKADASLRLDELEMLRSEVSAREVSLEGAQAQAAEMKALAQGVAADRGHLGVCRGSVRQEKSMSEATLADNFGSLQKPVQSHAVTPSLTNPL
jgi:chromosome segregation ATPase